MITGSLGRRYAKALMSIGRDKGDYEKMGTELAQFAELVAGNSELRNFVSNPLFPFDKRRAVVDSITTKLGLSKTVHDFLVIVLEKNRMRSLPEISRSMQYLIDQELGRVRATIRAPQEVSTEVQARLKTALEQKTGKKILLETEQDPSLIGGIVAQVGDLVFDGSVRSQLERMRQELLRE